MDTTYSQGSEWRIWDLHVHTPASIEHNYHAKNDCDVWENYISDLESLPDNIKVLGINDYLFLDGYRKVLEYKNNGRLKNIELILPVVEFRLARFCGTKQFKRINYHLIFSNELSIDVIENQFLKALSSEYALNPESKQVTWDGFITRENLQRLGENIIQSVPKERQCEYDSPIKEGFNNLNLEITAIENVLNKASSFFKGKYLTAIGKTEWDELKWDDSSIAEKKTIINKVDFIFTAAENLEKYTKGKKSLQTNGVKDLLLDCSDSHNNIDCTSSKDKLGNCLTWIKADPTFEGLKQALIEPEERIFVGETPTIIQTISDNKTKYIDKLYISHKSDYSGSKGKWFENIEIPFNKELVAIIGNKGSGKSAIADILAHCCDVHKQEDFSFLHTKKFRKDRLADNFYAEVCLADGRKLAKDSLGEIKGDDIKNTEPYVKYLPQGYFETICNDLQKEENLKRELENVVFQYVDFTERLGASNFIELITNKTKLVETEVEELKRKLYLVNKDIIVLEKKENTKYKEWILSEIEKKQAEINALSQPNIVEKPNNSTAESQKIVTKITTLKTDIGKIEQEIETKTLERQTLFTEISNLESVVSRINNLGVKINEFKSEIGVIVSNFGIDINDIMQYSLNIVPIEAIISEKRNKLQGISILLSEDSLDSQNLYFQKCKLEKKLKEQQLLLNGPELEYQTYLKKKAEYDLQKKMIEGSTTIPNSLKWLEAENEYLKNQLTIDIKKKCEERNKITQKIYENKLEVVDIYQDIKKKIDKKIKENKDLLGTYNIKIEASLSIKHSFHEDFLYYIKQNVKGSFKGKNEGEELVKRTIADHNLLDNESVLSFCTCLVQLLKSDVQKDDEKRFVEEQVDNIQGLYDYIFSLDYLQYNYQLKQGDKDLSLLSPGEKGALLLVFYLLLDMDNKPLLLDQPEDNLDNDSVANILVNFIKRAKKKRQIIMVTHNPNLAVVADAEQIIYAHIDKQDNFKFSVETGSIENPQINKHIVDVLEGAMPAFRKRDDKYMKK